MFCLITVEVGAARASSGIWPLEIIKEENKRRLEKPEKSRGCLL